MNEPTAEFGLNVDDLVDHHDANVGEVRLHFVTAGPTDGPPVVLLHGFPEFWYSWRHQIVALAQAGYRVIAPDQRGYNTSDHPSDIRAYTVDKLVGDIVGLLDHLRIDKAHVIGHDWGAVVAWFFAMNAPDHLDKLAILNVPHPIAMRDGLKTFRQLRKSWYMAFFQLPILPERVLSAKHGRQLRRLFRGDPVNRDSFSHEDIDRYIEAIVDTGAIRTMLHWYRAAARYTDLKSLLHKIDAPTLVIWGTEDLALGEELAVPPETWVTNARVEKLHASHWVQCDAPDRVNALLLHYLAES